MPLINCEASFTLTWSENCVLTDITTQAARNANLNADSPVEARERIDAPTNTIFQKKTQNCMFQLFLCQLKMIIIKKIEKKVLIKRDL